MKTETFVRRVMTISETTNRVNALAPKLFEGLAAQELTVVLESAIMRRFEAHTILASEGHAADKLFLILEGRARTFTTTRKGDKVLLLRIPAGDASGGRALLSKPTEYLVSTETTTDCYALVWNRSTILALTKQYPVLLENALMVASNYLAAYRDMHVASSHHTASQRVAEVLEKLAQELGRRGFEGTVINVSNEDLANEANVTIFTVSRLLSEWQKKGLLVKSRGKVVIPLPEELVQSAS